MLEKWWKAGVLHQAIVGLDLSADGIKLIELVALSSSFRIEHIASAPLPVGAIVKNEVKDTVSVSAALKNLLTQANITNKQVAIAVPRSSVTIKTITMDRRFTAHEIESRAWVEAARLFPELIGGIYLDYQVMPSATHAPATLDLMLVACRKEHIDPYLTILQQSDLVPVFVDVNCYALKRALTSMLTETFNPNTVALLNLDFSLSSLVVMQQGELIYAHDHNYDGHRLMHKAQEYLKQSSKIAVTEKQEAVGAEETDTESTSSPDHATVAPNDTAYVEILRENLIAQLRHAMHFFYSSRPTTTIETLVLTGDCVNLPGLATFVQQEIGITTITGNPLATMQRSPHLEQEKLDYAGSNMTLSFGLSMGGEDRINLLPWRETERKNKKNRFLVLVGVIATIALSAALMVHVFLANQVSYQKSRNTWLQSQISAEQTALSHLQKQKQEAADYKEKIHFFMGLQQQSNNVIRMLNELPNITPGSVALTSLADQAGSIVLEGIVQSDLDITLFMQHIEASQVFLTPELKKIHAQTTGKQGEKSFELTIEHQ